MRQKPLIDDFAVVITANRNLTNSDKRRIWKYMAKVVRNPKVEVIYFGGARGGDTWALRAARKQRQGNKPKLVVVVPYKLKEQPRETWHESTRADDLVELRNEVSAKDGFAAYRKRNTFMVQQEGVGKVVAFWNGDARSGTAMTLNIAKKMGLSVRVIPIEGTD